MCSPFTKSSKVFHRDKESVALLYTATEYVALTLAIIEGISLKDII